MLVVASLVGSLDCWLEDMTGNIDDIVYVSSYCDVYSSPLKTDSRLADIPLAWLELNVPHVWREHESKKSVLVIVIVSIYRLVVL